MNGTRLRFFAIAVMVCLVESLAPGAKVLAQGAGRGGLAQQQGAAQKAGAAAGAAGAMAGAAAPATAPAPGSSTYRDALQLYQQGRSLESAGRQADAERSFRSSLAAVEQLLLLDPSNVDLVNLQCWDLFRLGQHKDVVLKAQKLLQTKEDYRIEETMAESLYFLGQTDEALRAFARYMDKAPPTDERLSSAYYYMGECHARLKQYEHADIAFTTAVTLEPGMYYWWYRLGWVREALGLYRQSYDAYSKSLALNPGFKFANEGRQRVKAKADL